MGKLKKCRKCLVPKPHNNFSKASCNKDGLFSYCKSCKAAIDTKYFDKTKSVHSTIIHRCKKENYATVCDEWLDYSNFLKDMGERPSIEHQIDRIDHSKGYSPDNCRWVTKSQQMMNRHGWSNKKWSQYKGVHYKKDGYRKKRWHAIISVDKKNISVGYFETEIEAAIAYNEAALKYHGDFALLNEIKGVANEAV